MYDKAIYDNVKMLAEHEHHKRLRRNQTSIAVATSSTLLTGPNDKRECILISSPPGNVTDQQPQTQFARAISTATTGNKISATIGATMSGTLFGASQFETTGTGVVSAVQLNRSGFITNIAQLTTTQTFSGTVPLTGGDIVTINVLTAIAASVCDFTLWLATSAGFGRITVSFGAPAVLDQGLNIHPGQTQLLLLYDHIGDAIREDIFAISALGTPTIGVLDLFWP